MPDHQVRLVRLYDTVFDRVPDAGGLDYWVGVMGQGHPLSAIAGGFMQAPEFAATYGQPTNRSFVESLYENILDRPGEEGGVAFWTGALDEGRGARETIVVAFSDSPEHIVQMAAAAAAPAPAPGPAAPPPEALTPEPAAPAPAAPQPPASSPGVVRDPNGYPVINGTDGADVIYGTTNEGFDPTVNYRFRPGDDAIRGLGGADLVEGLSGNDYIEGHGGGDTLRGGEGDDYLIGGEGFDRLNGGPGADVFVFSVGDGFDVIEDFQRGDRIQPSSQTVKEWQLLPSQGGMKDGVQGATLSYGVGIPLVDQVFLAGITEADLGWVREAIFA